MVLLTRTRRRPSGHAFALCFLALAVGMAGGQGNHEQQGKENHQPRAISEYDQRKGALDPSIARVRYLEDSPCVIRLVSPRVCSANHPESPTCFWPASSRDSSSIFCPFLF